MLIGNRIIVELNAVVIIEERTDFVFDTFIILRRSMEYTAAVIRTELVIFDEQMPVLDYEPGGIEHLFLVVHLVIDRDVGIGGQQVQRSGIVREGGPFAR